MSLLIKKAKIIHPDSSYNGEVKDMLVQNGKIIRIADEIKDEKATVISSAKLHASIGWMDIGTVSGEPGYEQRETFESLSKTAAAGGYTAIAVFPNTMPVSDSKSSIQYVSNTTKSLLVDFLPIASVSKGCKGVEITEMIDLKENGAIAFSDGVHSIESSGLMLRALQYSKVVDGIVIHQASDPGIANGNDIHEGTVSTSLGLKASPVLSEVLAVERDLRLAEYAEGRLLVHNISSAESVEKLKAFKSKNVYCSVPYLNLCKTDQSIASFDVNYKTCPPLRSEGDREALVNGIRKNVIDIISSNHVPLEEELKKKEFVYADAGATGLQTCFSALCSFAKDISIKKMVKCLALNPRHIFGLGIPAIEEGAEANLCLFDPEAEWELNETNNFSLSRNSPFWNQKLNGKVIAVIKARQNHINNY